MSNLPKLLQVPSPNFSRRLDDRIDVVVAHACQGSGRGSAAWFALRQSQVSAHIVLDESGEVAYQCVPLGLKAWHACGANSYSIGVELGGYVERGFSDAELGADALIVAWLLHAYGIPCKMIDGVERGGWTTHYRLGAFGGGHSDFTTDPAAEAAFGQRIEAAYAELGKGPLAAWALHGAPAPHQTSLPPAPPEGFVFKPHALRDDHADPYVATLSGYPLGSLGDWQWRLRRAGANPQLQIDTLDGPATKRAIETFQRAWRLPVTGVEDAATWAQLQHVTR